MAKPRLPLPKWNVALPLRELIRDCEYVHVSRDGRDAEYPYAARVKPHGRQLASSRGINAVDAMGAALALAFGVESPDGSG